MATGPMSDVVEYLRKTAMLPDGAGMTDGALLDAFVIRRDDAAFAALVRRHGPMVWGVCRRLLASHHDAEDAFQATFLVLVRKAPSVVPREMVGNWLYGVAYQTALNARATAARKRTRERQVTQMPEPAAPQQDLWRDLQGVLDQELSRLPEKYRGSIVLCDLEGKTRKDVAQQFGVPEGTLSGWLTRGREMLAKRLARRGVALSSGALTALLVQNAASASVPAPVVSSTINAACVLAAGQTAGAVSVQVAALTQGVIKTMFVTKLKSVMAVTVAMVVTVGIGAGLVGYETAAAEQKERKRPDPDTAKKDATPQTGPSAVHDKLDQDTKAQSNKLKKDTVLLNKTKEFVAALHKGDANTLKTLVTDDCVMVTPESGRTTGPKGLPPTRTDVLLEPKVTTLSKETVLITYEGMTWAAQAHRYIESVIWKETGVALRATWIFQNDKLILVDINGKHLEPSTFKLMPDQSPKAIDFWEKGLGPAKPGIYSLEGDLFQWCSAGGNNKIRPTSFASAPGSKQGLILLRRQKD